MVEGANPIAVLHMGCIGRAWDSKCAPFPGHLPYSFCQSKQAEYSDKFARCLSLLVGQHTTTGVLVQFTPLAYAASPVIGKRNFRKCDKHGFRKKSWNKLLTFTVSSCPRMRGTQRCLLRLWEEKGRNKQKLYLYLLMKLNGKTD